MPTDSEVPTPPQAVILAGPNGSGKSTVASQLVEHDLPFINADRIAAELEGKISATADINAGRILLEHIDSLEGQKTDFAFETTLSSRMLVFRIDRWRSVGYQVHLIYLYLPSEEMAIERVAGRVLAGGHNVPEETIRRRYRAGLRNFFRIYTQRVDTWRLYDSSGEAGPTLIAKFTYNSLHVRQPELWNLLREEYSN